MNLYEDLKYRKLLYDVTSEDFFEFSKDNKITFYLGCDPTADSLHIGHLLVYLLAKRLQNLGHKPILLIGGGTGFIGDPRPGSERELLSEDIINNNIKKIKSQVENLLPNCEIVNNYDWISKIDLITFLRDFGKNFNVNYMINKDTVKSRLDSGISYTEFSYQILQALDFDHLYKNNNCILQIGGQDQWGNITSGLELIRKNNVNAEKVYGLTVPLLKNSDGNKFGKSEGNAIWLDNTKTSAYEFYQFFINISDEDVIDRLKQFTFLEKKIIDDIEIEFNEKKNERLAQKTLAKELTILIHGEKGFNDALVISEALFTGDFSSLNKSQMNESFKIVPSFSLTDNKNIVDVLIHIKLASSKRESREFINNGAISLNGVKVKDINFELSDNDFIDDSYVVVKRGKKKYCFIKK